MYRARRAIADAFSAGDAASEVSIWQFMREHIASVDHSTVGVYEIQQRMNGEKYLFAICQLQLTIASNQWHLYWMRKFDAWWPYPLPKTGRKHSLKARIQQVLEDEFGCFWG